MNTNTMNPLGLSITAIMRDWKPTAELGELPDLKFSNHPSPWGSVEYGMANLSKTRRVWINDYKDQLFIEVRFNLNEGETKHTQRFHFMISDERRISEDIARFFLFGTLPEYNPAKKQYVAYLATPDAGVRKASIMKAQDEKQKKYAEKEAAEKVAAEQAKADAKKPRVKKADPASVPVFSSPAAVEEVPAWKKALTSLTDLGMAFRNQKAT